MGLIGKLVRVVEEKDSFYEEKGYVGEVLAIKTMNNEDGTYIVLVLLENDPEKVTEDLKLTVERISKCKKIQKL